MYKNIILFLCIIYYFKHLIHAIWVLHMYLFATGILSLTPISFGADLGDLSLLFPFIHAHMLFSFGLE